jgi:hypothetical protein
LIVVPFEGKCNITESENGFAYLLSSSLRCVTAVP